MSYGWIDPSAYSINTLLLFDTWLVRYLSNKKDVEFQNRLAYCLCGNPAILWYFNAKCPDRSEFFQKLVSDVTLPFTQSALRENEAWILDALDWAVVYVYPEIMDQLPYITQWHADRLLSITDFTDKEVLDLGSGTGRLAIAAASRARYVYASEPVDRLREYLRLKLRHLQIKNVYVIDGTLEDLPFPENTFDIVTSGHVVGDDFYAEDALLRRVTRPGGWIIDCPGEEQKIHPEYPKKELIELGYKYDSYRSVLGGDVFRYWKQK
jgi:SAM-dependent methyltransferase